MKLIDLWKVADGQKIFIKRDFGYGAVMDGPGFPVVNQEDASDLVIRHVRIAHYAMYGDVLEIDLKESK